MATSLAATIDKVDKVPAIAVDGVSKVFGSGANRVVALDAVSIHIADNEFFTLLGPSGCGKTTLLRLIAGFEHPSEGHIALHGTPITGLPPFKRSVNTVFQSYALFPHMSVAENVGFGLRMLGRERAAIRQTVDEVLSLVRLRELTDRRVDQLSGGQQQRVALARALAPRPKVLLLDEPLSALDYKLRKDMQIELKRMQHQTGITFIFVTHDQEEALTMSDRIAVMQNGRILQVGSPTAIYDHPSNRFVADFIGDSNFLSAQVVSQGTERASVRIGEAGRPIELAWPRELAPRAEVTVAVRPEQARLVASDDTRALLQGTVVNRVYFGTDSHYHIDLGNDRIFVVREQNTRGGGHGATEGQTIGVAIDAEAFQVLRD